MPFETAIIERYKHREASVEESLIKMYLAGVSVRRVEDITQALWGTRVSPQTVSSNLNQKIYGKIEEWRNRPLRGAYPYVCLEGIWLKRSWGGKVKNISVLVALGVNEYGDREIIGVLEEAKKDKASWPSFLRELKERGLTGVLFISDKSLGLVESIPDFYPEAAWQRYAVHFYRDIMKAVPNTKIEDVMRLAKTIHSEES